jgi:hypothetical protein
MEEDDAARRVGSLQWDRIRDDTRHTTTPDRDDSAPPRRPFHIEAHSFGLKPGIDNQLVDQLEVEAFLEKHRREQ